MDGKRLENLLKFKFGAVDAKLLGLIPDFIADAVSEVNNWDWRFAETDLPAEFVLILNQEEYLLPDNFRKFKSAPKIEGASAPLTYADSSVIDVLYPKHDDTGEPTYYGVSGDKVLFYPVADSRWAGKKVIGKYWRNVTIVDLPEIFAPVIRNKILSEQLPAKSPDKGAALSLYNAQWPTVLANYKSAQEEQKTLFLDQYTENFNVIRNQLRVRPR